jgi:hypothetical protein
MSRSFKRNSIHGITKAESEKQDKRRFHKRFRRRIKNTLGKSKYDLDGLHDTIFPTKYDVSDTWLFAKDGKRYFNIKNIASDMLEYFKKLMRK